jgi:hypothetical protein
MKSLLFAICYKLKVEYEPILYLDNCHMARLFFLLPAGLNTAGLGFFRFPVFSWYDDGCSFTVYEVVWGE